MPWNAARIEALWTTQSAAISGAPPYLKKYVAGFAEMANLFEAAAGKAIDAVDMAVAISNCNEGDNPAAVRRCLINELEFTTDISAPPAAATLPLIAGTVIPAPPRAVAPEILAARQCLAAMRSPQKTRRGAIAARTAKSLLGQWRWVDRNPDSIAPYRAKLASETPYSDIHGFARWMQDGGAPPTGSIALNCREAVLVTAYMAGLLGHGQLRATYWAAEAQARKALGDVLLDMQRTDAQTWTAQSSTASAAYVAYVQWIDKILTGYPKAVPVDLNHGLIPQAGDVVFVRGTASALPNHVCLSLGRNRIDGRLVDEVASLWHHDNGIFTRATLYEMSHPDNLLYVPCPF